MLNLLLDFWNLDRVKVEGKIWRIGFLFVSFMFYGHDMASNKLNMVNGPGALRR
jgi:hypothetical protein